MKFAARTLATIALWTLVGRMSVAQAPAPPPTKPAAAAKTPPVISEALKLKFFKAQAQFSQAAEAAKASGENAQQKQVVVQDTVKEITKACGDEFIPNIEADGDPACIAKQPEPKK